MIDMALLSVLRRWHFREGMPIREITRRAGQCARKREAGRQTRTHRQSLNERRFGHSRRTRVLTVQSKRRRIAVSLDQQTLRKDQLDHYY